MTLKELKAMKTGLSFPDNFFDLFGFRRIELPAYPKQKRIALKRNSRAWKRLVLEVFARDEWKCFYCGKRLWPEYLSPCHIKSVGSGGNDTAENLRTCCKKCHLMEHQGEFLK